METKSDSDPQHTPARQKFLRLRDAIGLPPGGEIVHRHEVEQIADHFGIETEDRTKPHIVWCVIQRAKEHEYKYGPRDRTWEEAKQGCRDYTYIQSGEAEMIAKAAEAVNEFTWWV